MRESFKLVCENGKEIVVEFTVVKEDVAEKPYGISANIRGSVEKSVATRRFYTYAEAVASIDMLCRNQVTPCTLCDVI